MSVDLREERISVHDLEIGMHVIRPDKSWLETDFLIQGFIIQSQDQIDAFIRQCDHVYIEARVTRETSTKNALDKKVKSKEKIRYINKVAFSSEILQAQSTYSTAKSLAKNIMDGIRIGRMIDFNECKQTVDDIVDSILRNNNALVFLTKLKEKDEYTAEHSLNVCILSVAFAKHLGMEEMDIRRLGLGGLLHDVGKAKVPLEILNKEGRFTEEEFHIMKLHPVHGQKLLLNLPEEDRSAIDVAYSHHERIDATGYPRRLKANQIPYITKIVSVVDTYDAITSNRCYDKGRASMEALDIIYKCRGTQFDEELALEFIKCVGIYPPGSIVELTNGQVGICISTNEVNKLKPKIIIVLDEHKRMQKEVVVDLQNSFKDKDGNPYKIAKEVPNGSYGVDVREFLKKGLKIGGFRADS
jgi:HD-GYP domain-containing protein (c-di-GMP phosphodiesterase class II)